MFHATCWMHRRSRADYSFPARAIVNRHPSNAINPRDPANLVICKFKMDYATSCARNEGWGRGEEESGELCYRRRNWCEDVSRRLDFSILFVSFNWLLKCQINQPMLVNEVPRIVSYLDGETASLRKIQFSPWSLIAFVSTSVRAQDVSSFDYHTEGLPLPRFHPAIHIQPSGSIQEKRTKWSEK